MKKIVVTGGGGKLGRWVIQDLLAHDYKVLSVDQFRPENVLCNHISMDLNNLGEVYGVLKDVDAVVHLAAIPGPGLRTADYTFSNNVVSTFNVLEAATVLGINKAVIGSSESIYGIVWSNKPLLPFYVPIDEDHPQQVNESYGLSKQTNELTANMFYKRTGIQVVSLRFANIIAPEDYEKYARLIESPDLYKLNLWSYVDVRDAATSCRLAMEVDGLGAVALNITADDTLANTDTTELMKRHYPEVIDIRQPLDGTAIIYSNRKAKSLLGWQPEHSWREMLAYSNNI